MSIWNVSSRICLQMKVLIRYNGTIKYLTPLKSRSRSNSGSKVNPVSRVTLCGHLCPIDTFRSVCVWGLGNMSQTQTMYILLGNMSQTQTMYILLCNMSQTQTMYILLGNIKLMKGKALRKHSLHEKTAASVLLKLFISGNEWCHTTDAP